MLVVVQIVAFILLIALFPLFFLLISWFVRDFRKRSRSERLSFGYVLLVIVFFGWIPLLIGHLLFPRKSDEQKQREGFQNPEDAFAVATDLDMDGNWDAAIKLYQDCIEQWPEHRTYAESCIEQINQKKLAAQ